MSKKVARRRRQVAEAAQLRVHETDPDVVAWRVERTQRVVEFVLYAGIVCGLAFTVTNVQQFAAGDAPMSSTAWWTAWVLDPTVCALLIGVLLAGKTLQRYGVRMGRWAKAAGVIAAAATYAMNTWESWAGGVPSQIVLHSIPVVVVFVAVEVLAELRGLFAAAVAAAHARAELRATEALTEPVQERSPVVQEWSAQACVEPTQAADPAPGRHIADISERSADIVAYVSTFPEGVRAADVEAALNLPDSRRYLSRLAQGGRLRRIGRGLYTAVPSVPTVPLLLTGHTGQPDTRDDDDHPTTTGLISANGSAPHNGEEI